jgi:hypothetical protein
MPEVEHTTSMNLPREEIWEFVKDMNNWAPFLTGYQKHEILNETDSIWTLKGDVGILSRVVRLRAHVTEWNGPERVAFTLTGLNELVEGGGVLCMRSASEQSGPVQLTLVPAVPHGWLFRLFARLARFFLRRASRQKGEPVRPAPSASSPPPSSIAATACQLTFTLRMEAGGPTGPLVNAMLGPALLPAAEDLTNKIAAHLEQQHPAKP